MHKRPVLVTIVGCVFIAAGAIGFFYHLGEFRTAGAFPSMVWVELVRLIAACRFGASGPDDTKQLS